MEGLRYSFLLNFWIFWLGHPRYLSVSILNSTLKGKNTDIRYFWWYGPSKFIYVPGSPSRFGKQIIFLCAKRILKDKRKYGHSWFYLFAFFVTSIGTPSWQAFHSSFSWLTKWRLLENTIPFFYFSGFHLHIKQDKCPRIPLKFLANRIIKLPGFLLLEVEELRCQEESAEAASSGARLSLAPASLCCLFPGHTCCLDYFFFFFNLLNMLPWSF